MVNLEVQDLGSIDLVVSLYFRQYTKETKDIKERPMGHGAEKF